MIWQNKVFWSRTKGVKFIDKEVDLRHYKTSTLTSAIENWLYWCYMALQHIVGHFGRGQLTKPHCSWASLLGSLPVLGPILSPVTDNCPSWISRRERMVVDSFFITKSQWKNVLLDVRIEPATVRIPGGRASDRATAPGDHRRMDNKTCSGSHTIWNLNTRLQNAHFVESVI